jgi:predicted secreted protein
MEQVKEEILLAISQKRETKCQGTENLRMITIDLDGKNLSPSDADSLVAWLESIGYMANWSASPKFVLSISYMG